MRLRDLVVFNSDILIDAEDIQTYGHLFAWVNQREGITVSVPTRSPRKVYLHRLILTPLPTEVVDHINGSRLDNRRVNLRITTQQLNCQNRALNANSTTGHKGVTWHKQAKRYCAGIRVNGVRINLGTFSVLESAVAAYKAAEIKYFGEFARK